MSYVTGTPDDTPNGNLRFCVLRAPEDDDASREADSLGGGTPSPPGPLLPPPAQHVGGDEPGTCKRGHPRTPENVYVRSDGRRECAVCKRDAKRVRREEGHDHDSA